MSNICYGVDMSKEIWRTKPEWEGYYEFSNWGGARSVDRVVTYSNGRKRLHKGKNIKILPDGKFNICLHGKPNNYYLYNVIAELFIPQYIEGMPITSIDGDRTNCRLDNIQIGILLDGKCTKCTLEQTSYIIDKVPIIQGGFAEGQRVLFDITLAEKVGKQLGEFRGCNITPNLDNWEEGVDYINLKEYGNFNDYIPLLLELGYTSSSIIQAQSIYVFSERGVAKVMSSLKNSNPAKWEFLNNFVNEYFNMREQIKNQVPQISDRDLALLAIINSKSDVEQALAIKHYEEVVTQPLIETIEEQAPKVDKFDKYMESDGTYNPTNAAKQLGISSAQKFNSLLKEKKIQYKSGGNYVLYANYQWLKDEGYCKYKEGESNGHPYIQLRWYPKGINWLRDNILDVT